jgi:hypothetical protein
VPLRNANVSNPPSTSITSASMRQPSNGALPTRSPLHARVHARARNGVPKARPCSETVQQRWAHRTMPGAVRHFCPSVSLPQYL